MGDDKRRQRRQRVLKDGRIITLDHRSVVNCMVRDLSSTGARLKCGDQVAVPNEFLLQVGHDTTMMPAKAMCPNEVCLTLAEQEIVLAAIIDEINGLPMHPRIVAVGAWVLSR